MPFAHPPPIRAVILERLAEGARLTEVCAAAGMPCRESVAGWARADAGFAAAMAEARRRGDWRRRFGCDAAVARAVVMRLADGVRLEAVLAEPGMPSRATYRYWLATQGWFAEAVGHQLAGRAAGKAERLRGRRRAYDPAVGERLYVRLWKGGGTLREVLASDPAFPSLGVLARWRREQPDFDAMLRFVFDGWRRKPGRPGRGVWSDALAAEIVGGITAGGSLRSLAARPDMPCARTLYAWCRTRPDFAAQVARACVEREAEYLDRIVEIAERTRPGGVTAARREMAPLNAQLTRLRKRPGWKARRAGC